MAETPPPIPTQELVKADPRSSYITKINPDCVRTLTTLIEAQGVDTQKPLSDFWLDYFSKCNIIFKRFETYNESAEDIAAHPVNVKEYIDIDVAAAIVKSNDGDFLNIGTEERRIPDVVRKLPLETDEQIDNAYIVLATTLE